MEIYKIVLVEKQKLTVSFDFTDYLPWLRSLYISNRRNKNALYTLQLPFPTVWTH